MWIQRATACSSATSIFVSLGNILCLLQTTSLVLGGNAMREYLEGILGETTKREYK